MKRRSILLGAATLGGGLVLGWLALPPRERLGERGLLAQREGEVALNGWIKIGADGRVFLAMPRSEMGQGVHTALAMLVAEELEIDPAAIELVPAAHDAIYGNVAVLLGGLPERPDEVEPGRESTRVRLGRWVVAKLGRELGLNITGGSSSVPDAWPVLRLAAATVRAQLLGAASLQWRLPVEELEFKDGVLSHPSGPRAAFGELAALAARTPVSDVQPKPRSAWRVIGQPVHRSDIPAKVDGRARFGLDVRLPGLLFAAVRMCPMLGGSPGPIDVNGTLARPGVRRVVRLGPHAGSTPGVAVVARSTWHARQALEAMAIEWQAPPHDPARGLLDSKVLIGELVAEAGAALADDGGFVFHAHGEARAADRARDAGAGLRRVGAVYRAPFLAHATLEPMNCTARVADGRVEVWAPTQVPGFARDIAARVAGVPPEAVTVHVTLLGGGFGRRLEVDVIGQAVAVALECGGAPVQLSWSREEDMTHDFYRPAAAAALEATLDAEGLPRRIGIVSAGDALTPRFLARNMPALASRLELPDKVSSEGLFDLPYAIAHRRIAHRATDQRVPIGNWRAVGHSQNAFFIEAFIDELAQAGGRDPLELRLALLGHLARHTRVLKTLGEKSGWGTPPALPAGAAPRARGLALHESFGSIVGQVAEVSIESGRPRVHRVVCVADCGTVVNPATVVQQMESGIVFGLTAALHGRIDIVAGEVQQKNFPDYPLMPLAELPTIEVHLIDSTEAPGGVGEPGTPPIAPAVANALAVLTGRRFRELPLQL